MLRRQQEQGFDDEAGGFVVVGGEHEDEIGVAVGGAAGRGSDESGGAAIGGEFPFGGSGLDGLVDPEIGGSGSLGCSELVEDAGLAVLNSATESDAFVVGVGSDAAGMEGEDEVGAAEGGALGGSGGRRVDIGRGDVVAELRWVDEPEADI